MLETIKVIIKQNLTIRTAVRFEGERQAASPTWATAIYIDRARAFVGTRRTAVR